MEDDLRARGFTNDTSPGAPICRWLYKTVIVDVMPTDEKLLGFSNKWYPEGIENKTVKKLPDETEIFIFSPAYYIAAKLEAHKNRGGQDLRQSHDFEDIIYILDNCPNLLESITGANSTVKIYLKEAFTSLLHNRSLIEGVESALPYGAGAEATDIILALMQNIADLT